MRSTDYVAIDFETANEKRASACAVGIAVVRDGEIAHRDSWLIRPPEMRFNPINISIHGIRPADVVNAPTFSDLWPTLLAFLDGKQVVAHNAGFDMSVLRHTLDVCGLVYPNLDYSCTYQISRSVWPGLRNHRLSSVAAHLGWGFNHHDAEDDAAAAAHIALRACDALGHSSLPELLAGLKLSRKPF